MKGFNKGAQTGKLAEAGRRMGFKQGGQVKDTSSEFHMRTEKQQSMDNANTQRREGTNQRDVESGGKTPLRPKFKFGGDTGGGQKAKGNRGKGAATGSDEKRAPKMSANQTTPRTVVKKGGKMSRREYAKEHGTTKGYREAMKKIAGASATKAERRRARRAALIKKAKEEAGGQITDKELKRLERRLPRAEGGPVPGHHEGENPYNMESSPSRYRMWERKYHEDPPEEEATVENVPDRGEQGYLRRLFGRSGSELEEMGESHGGRIKHRVGGPVAAKRGGIKKVHKGTPLYGKK